MKHLTAGALGLAALALTAGSTLAQPDALSPVEVAPAHPARALYVCDTSADTVRSFQREFGEVRFLTADQVLKSKQAWSAPRCITAAEYAKLSSLRPTDVKSAAIPWQAVYLVP